MNNRLLEISRAYDLTVEQHRAGIDPLAGLPAEFRASAELSEFLSGAGPDATGSNAPENRQFLDPQSGMRFLDAGCCANLANYRFDLWLSVYYGVDISPKLINAMRAFASANGIAIGGLEVAQIAALPFEDDFFDIASVIGVLEYADQDYCGAALSELNRVLKSGARMVVDIPNLEHPHVQTMFRLESYLGRPNTAMPRMLFEDALAPLFTTVRVDDTRVMLKYFLVVAK
jgi:SAM-dependent methyltransferase